MIVAEELAKRYPTGQVALDALSVRIGAGQFVGVLGSSGAGKTTFLRLINGALQPSSGRLEVLGTVLGRVSAPGLRRLRRRIGVVYQHHDIIPPLSAAQNVLLGELGGRSTLGALRSFLYLTADERQRAFAALSQLGLGAKLDERAENLSGGEQQRVAVARALLRNPELLLADEPIASVDARSGELIMELLRQANEERGLTIVVNLHQVDFALRYCKRLLVLAQGKLVFDGPPGDLSDFQLYEDPMPDVAYAEQRNGHY
ncbi:MAG: ATP-binding cassette domain-containing protein [Chloroflexi bacterium]|nr:ATP-binding cassette domain-containing protein [Chloroflexota bacterium]